MTADKRPARPYIPRTRPTPSGGKLTEDGLLIVYPEPVPASEVERRLVALTVNQHRGRVRRADRRAARRAARRVWRGNSFIGSLVTLAVAAVLLVLGVGALLTAFWFVIVLITA